ncbi:hypothetical protein ACSXB8_16275 (plasmid) [Clostridium perfringens]|uniref:hypothetical protein n=1 Tax=Clostridium perfringens TaxID=1502 RepID=UPI00293FCB85|nr:hypothetical protein [Clostridium perfringens]MDV5113459.1 hypothetical protein [Clostridium perfringens]
MDILKMNINEIVILINRALEEDRELSVNKWCDKVGVNKSTLKSKLNRGNYIYNSKLRIYLKKDITSNITDRDSKIKNNDKNTIMNSIKYIDKDIDLEKLNTLLNNLEDLLSLIPKKNITSNITIENKETTVKTLRVNTELYNKIRDKAAKENITIGSILNNALLDYLNKYGE